MASYALELHALKAELQSTLARLGVDPISSDDDAAQNTAPAISEPARRRSRRRPTRWNRRRLTQELAAASQRRQEFERQLQQEIQRREEDGHQQDQNESHRTAWQAAITELQQQRAEIRRQMEQDTTTNTVQTEEAQPIQNQVSSFPIGNSEENQFSIGGVVTLEPLSSSQRGQVATFTSSRSGVSFQPVAPVSASACGPLSVLDTYPRYRPTPDALNDVLSLQLKFAETMLKLEKSWLHRDPSVVYRASHSESFSSSAHSFSSLDSTPHRPSVRVRYPNFGVSRATTAETLAPSSSGAEHSPESETNDAARTLPLQEPPTDTDRTPTTGSSVTTPTTGSDQKSNTSSSKQVRFGEDAYSTPILARKFNFDGPSMDEDDDEEKEQELESVLSFLDGSSVTSVELNDASFLRAFERFRRELNVSSRRNTIQSPQPPLARKLFPGPSDAVAGDVDTSVASAGHDDGRNTELERLDTSELQERRRQLCLDIQAESAQLVLNFGTGATDAEQTKNRLLTLRDELKAVDAQLNTGVLN
ncbi:hypothetical protein PInf_005669 [Phytophthora infestans]|nr:hypothetical protein PInf_005669 [Phytophthora infestans]